MSDTTKQMAMFRMALAEAGMPDADCTIDHARARCRANGREYGVVFPRSFVDRVAALQREVPPQHKELRYVFFGVETERRQWVRRFARATVQDDGRHCRDSLVRFTTRGRDFPKDFFHEDYYRAMCRAEFALCPVGDFVWTYRYLEAALCGAIPIVEEFDRATMPDFRRYRPEDKHIFRRPEWAEENRQLFLERCTIGAR